MAETQAAAATTTPVAAPAPVPGSAEYTAAMAAKGANTVVTNADGTTIAPAAPVAAPAKAARPAHVPEKFWNADKGEVNVEALAKSYTELEKAKPAPAADPTKPAESKLGIPPADPNAAVAAAGLDMAALQTEFTAKGDLTPESYAALDKAGIPKPMVQAYIEGQKALAAQYDAEAFTTAGGEDNYGKLTAWAKTGLTADEQTAFNRAVTSGDRPQMKLAVAGLKSRYEQNFGTTPNLAQGTAGTASGDVYASAREMTTDMKNPLYKTDAAYRARVEAKIGRSPALGTVFTR